MELGVRVIVREVETFEDVGEARAPSPVGPGELVATELGLYRVEIVLPVTAAARCVPMLGRRLELEGIRPGNSRERVHQLVPLTTRSSQESRTATKQSARLRASYC